MEFKSPEYYRQQRAHKRRRRATKNRATLGVSSAVIILFLVIFFSYSSLTSKKGSTSKADAISTKPFFDKKILIAKSGKLSIYLPFKKNFIALGYHKAFNPLSYEFQPIGSKVNTKKMSKERSLAILGNKDSLSYLVLDRGGFRQGSNISAIDIGSNAGNTVYAPVNGTVKLIRPYKLYGYIDDFEIHIQPNGYRDRHAVIIHVTDPAVNRGDVVIAGETPIAKVRKLSNFFPPQMHEYTHEAGNHMHVQINKIQPWGECYKKP